MTRDEQLEAALSRVTELEAAYGEALVAAAEAESEYRVRFSKAYLAASGTEQARKSIAICEVERFLRERDRTEAIKEFMREKLRDAQAAVSARQSLLKVDTNNARAFGGF